MAVTASVGLSNAASDAVIAVPVPFVPTASMKYSAAVMLLLPEVTSLTLAVTVGAVLVGLGVATTLVVVGPPASPASPTTNWVDAVPNVVRFEYWVDVAVSV